MTVALTTRATKTMAWMNKATGWICGMLVLGSLAAIVALGYASSIDLRTRWYWTLGLMALILVAIGVAAAGRAWAILIDDRNKFSLSRLQLVLWTLIALSAYFAIALRRLATEGDPLAIGVPEELWWLMGISTTTLIGTPLLRSYKTDREPLPSERAATLDQLRMTGRARGQTQPENRGLVLTNVTPDDARWTDLFMGEETGNASKPDMGKIQMFFFTVILLVTYVFIVVRTFEAKDMPTALPALPAGMIALLGISHAGYLANKAVPHSSEANEGG